MTDSNPSLAPPYLFLIFGAALISAAVVFSYIGKVWVRFHGWVYRAERPVRFSCEVAAYCLGGILLIAVYFFRVYVPGPAQ